MRDRADPHLAESDSVLTAALATPQGVVGARSIWSGAALQLAGVVLFAVLFPLCLSAFLLSDFTLRAPTPWTLAVAGAAGFTGAILFRSIGRYPGIASSSYVFPCILPPYALAALYLLLARQEYSRLIFVSSGAFSLIWFYAVFFMQQRVRQMRIALVPFGTVEGLETIPGISWHVMKSSELTGATSQGFWPDAVAADLRADIPNEWDRALADFVLAGIPVYDVKQLLESLTGRVEIKHLSENSFGSLAPLSPYLRLRSVVDKIIALAAIVCLTPLLLVVAVLVRIDSPGPALFRQERVGYRGIVFEVIKFRTMRLASDSGDSQIETAITKPGDRRITRLGQLLRRSRIDELPQIINILRGEMSWIGPRPEAVVLSRWYEQEIPFYRYRHIVPPGITGWAQVRLGHVAQINEVQEKLHYDFYYIKHFSLWLDFLITLKTLKTMFTGFGAR
ncbi:sugar transferase [Sphingomonas sp. DG1-23]|uniref:sugar transferase n=1 Tax=Sphingomonas sp. DG1-23 TaxID=3068316 RepID=UPI00273EF2C0|nr:sugar transferase [Sphingomonas sp. DG1-23]MDP5280687.1 sugar transferase [Sphingomonas sp. DG1-23]